jgi:hypothetical protein
MKFNADLIKKSFLNLSPVQKEKICKRIQIAVRQEILDKFVQALTIAFNSGMSDKEIFEFVRNELKN